MAKNIRGTAGRVHFTASANRSSGDFVTENGFHGVVVNDVASGADGVMDTSQVEIEVPVGGITSPAKGDLVYMALDNSLSKTATAHRLVGRITAVAGAQGTPTGFVRILVGPQTTAAATA